MVSLSLFQRCFLPAKTCSILFLACSFSTKIREQNWFIPRKKIVANQDAFLEKIRKRVFTAALPLIVISRSSEASITSSSDIISLCKTLYNIDLSPGTVYPVLHKLEKEGKIARLPRKRKEIYVLTDSGRALITQETDKVLTYIEVLFDTAIVENLLYQRAHTKFSKWTIQPAAPPAML